MGTFGVTNPQRLAVGTPAADGAFPLGMSTYTAPGVSIPPLSLERWFRARDNSANELVEVVVRGDSTFAGQVVGLDLPDDHYSPVTRMRELLNEAGYTDGGHGLNNGVNDTPSISGDAVSGTSGVVGFGGNDSFQIPSEVGVSSALDDTITFHGYGTRIRIFYRTSSVGGPFTYSVDGGSTVAIDASVKPSGSAYNFDFISIDVTDGAHTVAFVNTSGASMNVMCDFIKPAGIVLHNHSVRGAATSAGLTSAQALELLLGLKHSPATGESDPVTDASLRPLDERPNVRRPVLYVHALGINNQQSGGGTDTSAALKAHTILYGNAARAAGADFLICIPAFESASQSQLADQYRDALKEAAEELAAPWVDLGMGGALPGMTAGSTDNNPHLTRQNYEDQGTFAWEQVLGL